MIKISARLSLVLRVKLKELYELSLFIIVWKIVQEWRSNDVRGRSHQVTDVAPWLWKHRIAQRTSSKSPGLGEGDRGVCLGMAMVGAYRLHDSYGDE